MLIPYSSFPDVRRSGIAITTRLVEWCPFLLRIERLSDIGRPDFRYRYSFIYKGQSIAFDRIGYFGVRVGSRTIYQLDDQTHALVSEMDRFNTLPPEQKTRAESWLAFSKVKECATDVGASLDRYLQSNDVIVPKSVHLDIHEWPDGSISFAPQVSGIEGDGLKRAFFHSPTVESFYSVDGPNNSRLRVVFDDRQTEVLQRMKAVHRAYGKLKPIGVNPLTKESKQPRDGFTASPIGIQSSGVHYISPCVRQVAVPIRTFAIRDSRM